MHVEKLHNFNFNVMLTTLVARPFLKVVKQLFSGFLGDPCTFAHHYSQMINMLAITSTLTYWCDNIHNFLFAASALDASFKDCFSPTYTSKKGKFLRHPS